MDSLERKKTLVKDLVERVGPASAVYLTDFKGIDVESITRFRSGLRDKGVRMQVVKNTILKRVFAECKMSGLEKYLVGPTSILLGTESDPAAPAKAVVEFQKENDNLMGLKAVRIESEIFEGDRLGELARMPGRIELQARVVAIALGPASGLIGLLLGPGRILAGQIEALIKKREQE